MPADMINNLPTEIAANIAIYLSKHRLRVCISVSRSWYAAFISALYNTVEIRSERQLNRFIEVLRDTEAFNPLGDRVRRLILPEDDCISDHVIAPLPHLCPSITNLDCGVEWSPEHLAILREWKHVPSIRSITVRDFCGFPLGFVTTLAIHTRLCSEWMEFIAKIPCIENLEVIGGETDFTTDSFDIEEISLCALETLHDVLPHLQTFDMSYILIYGEMPQHITPCDRIHGMSLFGIGGHLWGQYFARKYTNIEKLRFDYNQWTSEDTKTELMALTRSCRHLKQLASYSRPEYLKPFFEILHQIDAPLADISFHGSDPIFYAKTVEDFHRSLSRVHFDYMRTDTFSEIVEPLSSCLHLTELRVGNNKGQHIEVDQILNHCKHLKVLYIAAEDICLTNNCLTTDPHGLRTLELYDSSENDDVVRHILRRCPCLSTLFFYFIGFSFQPRVIHISNPNTEALRIHFAYCTCIFKLTQISKEKKIRQWESKYQRSIDTHQIEGESRWFRADKRNHSFYELKYRAINTASDQLCEDQEPLKITDDEQTIWVQYHNIDEISLGGFYLPE